MEYAYRTLDVFTDSPFSGNPLAVFPDARGLDDDQMQRMALEMNLSETVFVFPPETASGARRIRIFTPGREVPFAGHPTVGTAFLLVAIQEVSLDPTGGTLVLEENVGPVPVTVSCREGRPVSAELTAAEPPWEEPVPVGPSELAALVSLPEGAVGAEWDGRSLDPAFASVGLPYLVLPVGELEAAEAAVLDTAVWRRLLPPEAPSRMVYVVAPGGRGADADFHVRMFAPDAGVPEDPATGSAAAALGGYLGRRSGDGEHQWVLEQGLEMGRPSLIRLGIRVSGGVATEVRVGGSAVLMSRGVMPAPG